ncbi:MAG: diguanylate cyclase, partial [Candidatus Neomarinimicrobiota bacterium]
MDDLKRLYRQALAARIDALEAAKAAFLDYEPDALDSLRRLAHSLKGSGGTYGFPNITDAAATLEGAAGDEVVPRTDALLQILKEVAGGGGAERKFGLLIVEDDPISARIMQSKLAAANREIHVSETAAQAKELLVAEDIHLVLLDLILPDTDGRNFLVWLREQPALAGLPVIITSAKGSAATKTECFALGADEYFEKPIDLDILASAVAAKMQRSGELARESRIDPLTKLPNRAALAEAFQRTQSQAQRSREPLSIAILDLDHFKAVNDTHGHATGDDVLRRLGTALTAALRGTDVVARWGGEEFVILFPNAGIQGSTNALE